MPLFQYKPEHYGRIVPLAQNEDEPREIAYPFKAYIHMADLPLNAKPWEQGAKYLVRRPHEGNDKFVLLDLRHKIVTGLHHCLKTEYVQVQTQNPFETDLNNFRPIIKWVEAAWIEPLTKIFNYETEAKQRALATLKKRWAEKK